MCVPRSLNPPANELVFNAVERLWICWMSKLPEKLRKLDNGGGQLLLSTATRLVKVAAMPR